MEYLERLTTRELQSLLSKRGLSVSYRVKQQLVSRLHSFLMKSADSDSENSCEEQSEEEGKEKAGNSEVPTKSTSEDNVFEGTSEENKDTEHLGNSSSKVQAQQLKNAREEVKSIMSEGNFLFKDVEESLETFTGESSKTFTSWVKDFNEIAMVCKWNDVQKFLYARRLLRGAAKLAVEAEEGITSWEKLKSKLEEEFGTRLSSMAIHQMLNSRKKRVAESFLEYLFSMKQIANKGNVDDESFIAYVVQGIPGDPRDKTILYEAKTVTELKEKYKIYEHIIDQLKQTKVKNELKGESSMRGGPAKRDKKPEKRCGNCGAFAHSSANCPNKQRGARCFACNEFGHIATNCPKRNSSNEGQVNRINGEYATISAKLGDDTYQALIDTGSCVTLVKESVMRRYGVRSYTLPGMLLRGFGSTKPSSTLGSTLITVTVQSIPFEILAHAVTDNLLSDSIILGKSFMEKAVVTIDGNKTIVRIRNSFDDNPHNPFETWML